MLYGDAVSQNPAYYWDNMLKGNVHFTWQGGYEVAKWEHLVQLYELDVDIKEYNGQSDRNKNDYRILNRLTYTQRK